MDIALIKTFLEVAATGSFVSASERLLVTQSAVSLRVQRLEASLGRPLFTRSKAGAELTAAGQEFERYALSMIKIWEEARQQVAIPEGFRKSLTIGAQYSLWPRLGFRWIDALREQMPDLNIRAELGMPDRLTRFLLEGVVQAGLLYTPQLRPGLAVERVIDEELVLVASWPNPTLDIAGRYVFVDWGPEFVQAHALYLPDLTNPGLTLSLGALTAEFIVNRQFAAYLPARYVKRYIDAGRLHLVPDAPRFPYPVWMVWREDLDEEVAEAAKTSFRQVVTQIDVMQDEVMEMLRDLSEEDISVLGDDLSDAPPFDEE
ncbi:LysR family transcriptional regulator [Actibacterium lipolyticum]|uniref:HTH-type transcriptional regulator GltR n=1 Tax=Actibacterium lipolyticum TaxID=1524263 RepID=A0A238KUY9_9RHOB|nr:LysR substrate-binding domain-containing protein [Actibacterium lipolyticum]SMX46609.1 HTH-type transcriptional regulator GltR [Actibacterium lipolyticum]